VSDWGAGFATGIAVGLAIGLATRRQKPWSELTDREKKVRKGLAVGLGIAVALGAVLLFVIK